MEIWGPPALSVALCPRGVVLESSDLSLELLVEQLQLLFSKDIFTFERRLFLLMIRMFMLFLYLLLHLIEHLKELVFLRPRRFLQ